MFRNGTTGKFRNDAPWNDVIFRTGAEWELELFNFLNWTGNLNVLKYGTLERLKYELFVWNVERINSGNSNRAFKLL